MFSLLTAGTPHTRLLTSSQVAALLNISTRTVCLWAECGEILGFKIGRHWRFREPDVLTWLTNTRTNTKK